MVSAEIAVALPAVVLVLTMALAGVAVTIDTVRCVDAARVGARAAARGDDPVAAARPVAPNGSAVDVARAGTDVIVTVAGPSRPLTAWLPPAARPQARSVAAVEEPEGAP